MMVPICVIMAQLLLVHISAMLDMFTLLPDVANNMIRHTAVI